MLGLGIEYTNVLDYPFVKWSVVLKFKRAKGIGDSLKRVLNRMCVVVKRIDAPLVALTVMLGVNYTVYCGVTHIHIRRSHIYLCAESVTSVGEFSCLHSAEEIEVFFNASVAVRSEEHTSELQSL